MTIRAVYRNFARGEGGEFRVWKKEGGGEGGRSSIVSGWCYTCYHSGMQNANSQAKIFSDCTNDLKILRLL